MLKTKIIFIFLNCLFLSFAIINCSDEIITPIPIDSSDFKYPFSDGSRWTYTRTFSASDIKPDSIRYYFVNYPIVINGTATILYDTIINSVITKCFLDEFTDNNILRTNRYYYLNNDTSLFLYARRQSGPAIGLLPLRKMKNTFFKTEGDNYENRKSLVLESLQDSLNSTLKYPITTGTEWTFTNTYGVTTIKKYIGFENVNVPAGTVSCMKLSSTILIHNTSIFDFFDYYSKYGLMKSYSFQDDITVSTVTNPDGIGTIDATDETVVSSYNITSD